jgi:transposase
MSHIEGQSREQSEMFPTILEDYIGAENPVRVIDAFVDSLDLLSLGFEKAETKETGRPPYHPGDLLKLYLYGYMNRLRSSRQLERATHQNVELLWLLRKLTPDFKTIADFRKDNLAALKGVCREFTLLCKRLQLFGGETIGIDGSKFAAVNHNRRVYTKKQLQEMHASLEKQIGEYFTLLETEDKRESGVPVLTKGQIESCIEHLHAHRVAIESLEKAMDAAGVTQHATTDEDSQMMRTGHGGKDMSYNVQIAVDSKHKLIVDADVTNDTNDLHQLSRMALRAKETLGVEEFEAIADAGYYKSGEIHRCEKNGIICYVPEPEKSQNKKDGLYTNKDFRYDAEQDCYHCPAGQSLTKRGSFVKGNRNMTEYGTSACHGCLVRSACTHKKHGGRRIYRWEHESIVDALRERMEQHPEKMQLRKELVEHPFGTMKQWMGHGSFLMRGLEKVSTEFSLTVLAYNIKRVLSILGVNRLIAVLKLARSRFEHFGELIFHQCAPERFRTVVFV